MSVFLHTGANSWLAQSLPIPCKVHLLHTHQWARLQHRTGNSYHYTLYPELCVQEIHNTGISCSLGTKKVILRKKKKKKKEKGAFHLQKTKHYICWFHGFFFRWVGKPPHGALLGTSAESKQPPQTAFDGNYIHCGRDSRSSRAIKLPWTATPTAAHIPCSVIAIPRQLCLLTV